MDTETFYRLWRDTKLREEIWHEVRRHFKGPEDQEDAVQEAWLRISTRQPWETTDLYSNIAYRAIHALYERQRHTRPRRKRYRVFVRRIPHNTNTPSQIA